MAGQHQFYMCCVGHRGAFRGLETILSQELPRHVLSFMTSIPYQWVVPFSRTTKLEVHLLNGNTPDTDLLVCPAEVLLAFRVLSSLLTAGII
ncbi:hypothetical protein SERLA73DRAFT_178580 [Serpula lacrymans var. lacrymans S7.3]|uniref:Uncharacterized protein n=1 Tax=Serpula lacrymans var. lacrymans (strain S7.3) TaxID=936435 RepID=F8PS27_SERL3|nr:hypothetical protein SERLA73DRAFT_178580 [Serpula lacrymans var. lacrymans S7.3]